MTWIWAVALASARTLTVGTGAQYATLVDAVNAASDGDVITVAPGRYTAGAFAISKDLRFELDPAAEVRSSQGSFAFVVDVGADVEVHGGEWQALIQSYGRLTVTDAAFTLDGGVAAWTGAEVEVTGCVFTGTAGATNVWLDASEAELTVSDCVFSDRPDAWISAIRGGLSSVTVRRSVFERLSVRPDSASSAAIQVTAGTLDVEDCTFEDNGGYAGGAIYSVNAETSVIDSTFTDNDAYNGGAVLHTGFPSEGSLRVEGSTFSGNSALENGGAINIWYGDAFTVLDSTFTEDQALNFGGAVSAISVAAVEIDGVTVTGSEASWGAIGLSEVADTTMRNSRIAELDGGAGVYGQTLGALVLEGNRYEDNPEGGLFVGGFTSIVSVNERYCRSDDPWNAGGLHAQFGDSVQISNGLFDGLSGGSGAAIYVQSVPDVILENSAILGTWSRGDGAARFVNATLDYRNNLLAHTVDGSGLWLDDTSFVLANSAWWDNVSRDVDGDWQRVSGTGHVLSDPRLTGWTSGACDLPVFAGNSPLIDAGLGDDLDGSPADIGPTGGPYADPGLFEDRDGDGFAGSSDCDDTDDAVYPGATERCNDVDDDCDGAVDSPAPGGAPLWFRDSDRDGYGDPADSRRACDVADLTGVWVQNDDDCAPADRDIHPGAVETCDDVDQDCDGAIDDGATDGSNWFVDADGDTFGDAADVVSACDPVAGRVRNNRDCDDGDDDIHPDADELCNDVDDDCDGSTDDGAVDAPKWYADGDGDGVGAGASTVACDAPRGHVATRGDCDDRDDETYPGAPESCADGAEDRNCDGSTGQDDGDGDGVAACDDCDDGDADVNPDAREDWYDGVDQDCDGESDYDADGDGEDAQPWGDDCDDEDPTVDEDCGTSDEEDPETEDPESEDPEGEQPDPEDSGLGFDDELRIAGCAGCAGSSGIPWGMAVFFPWLVRRRRDLSR